jgi:hypothetical protein
MGNYRLWRCVFAAALLLLAPTAAAAATRACGHPQAVSAAAGAALSTMASPVRLAVGDRAWAVAPCAAAVFHPYHDAAGPACFSGGAVGAVQFASATRGASCAAGYQQLHSAAVSGGVLTAHFAPILPSNGPLVVRFTCGGDVSATTAAGAGGNTTITVVTHNDALCNGGGGDDDDDKNSDKFKFTVSVCVGVAVVLLVFTGLVCMIRKWRREAAAAGEHERLAVLQRQNYEAV